MYDYFFTGTIAGIRSGGSGLIICHLSFYQMFRKRIDNFLFLIFLSYYGENRNKFECRMSNCNLVNIEIMKMNVELFICFLNNK